MITRVDLICHNLLNSALIICAVVCVCVLSYTNSLFLKVKVLERHFIDIKIEHALSAGRGSLRKMLKQFYSKSGPWTNTCL